MTMDVKGLLSILVLAVIIGNVSGYFTMIKFEVCEFTFSSDMSYDGFDGEYHAEYPTSGGAPWIHDPVTSFGWNGADYEFTDGTNSVKLKQENYQTAFFSYLWEHRDDVLDQPCSCQAGNAYNAPFSDPNNKFSDVPNALREVETFKICSTWEDIEDPVANAIEAAWSATADTWKCRFDECDELYDLFDIDYQELEVFSDPNCKTIARGGGNDNWRCRRCDENNGWFKFDTEPGQKVRNKCRNCQEHFGDSCEYCQRANGCGQCTQAAVDNGFTIIPKTAECELQYCGEICCETDTTAVPVNSTPQPTVCVDVPIPGGGSGTTEYDCRTGVERGEDSDAYGDRYTLPEPVHVADCENGVAYNCVGADDPNCDICNAFIGQNANVGCNTCQCSPESVDYDDPTICPLSEQHFWYSNAVPCAPCSAFVGCLECQNGGDFGGGGCVRCDGSIPTVPRYDEEIGVWYCALGDDSHGATTQVPVDNWSLSCIDECSVTRGPNDVCDCGCDCNGCTISKSPLEPAEEPHFCIDCHYDAGCEQCYNDNTDARNDYFALSRFHPCVNCYDTFGDRCLFCNDGVGCAQCAPGYDPVKSTCCDVDMWYCELQSTFN